VDTGPYRQPGSAAAVSGDSTAVVDVPGAGVLVGAGESPVAEAAAGAAVSVLVDRAGRADRAGWPCWTVAAAGGDPADRAGAGSRDVRPDAGECSTDVVRSVGGLRDGVDGELPEDREEDERGADGRFLLASVMKQPHHDPSADADRPAPGRGDAHDRHSE